MHLRNMCTSLWNIHPFLLTTVYDQILYTYHCFPNMQKSMINPGAYYDLGMKSVSENNFTL